MNYNLLIKTLYHKLKAAGLCLLLVAALQVARAQDEVVDTTAIVEEEYDDEYYEDEQTYIPDTLVLRQVPPEIVDSLQHDEDFAYANDDEFWKKEIKKEASRRTAGKGFWERFYEFFAQKSVRVIAYVLIGGLILFLLFKVIVQNNLYLFYNSKKLSGQGGEDAELEMDPETLEEKLKKALAEKNYRLAVRYYYLKTLKILDEKGLIRLHAQATNYQYLQQMSSSRLANDFRFLTDVYDYVWYGEFPLTENQFERVDTGFRNFYQAVKL